MPHEEKMPDMARIFSPVVNDDEKIERQCGSCKIAMPAVHRNEQNSKMPWRERGIDYECTNCQETHYVANANSISITVGISIIIVTVIGYLLFNGLLDFILNSLQDSIISVVISLVAIVAMAFAARFAWERLKRAAELIEGRFTHPLVNRKPGINMINLSLTMGLLPWLIAMAIGYLNNAYQLLEGRMVWLLAPLVLAPIILGKAVGSTKMNVFLATMFWLLIVSFIVWLTR